MFDKEGIIDHLRELEDASKDWKRYQSISFEELKTSRDKRNMILHSLLVSIQSSIDIANHIIAERGLRKPSTYREVFDILGEEKIVPLKLADNLSDLAGFRNVLVHVYWKLNLEEIYSILQNDLKFLEEFKQIVKDLLKKE